MFIGPLFIIAKLFALFLQCQYELASKWINKLCSINTTEYYSAIKKEQAPSTCTNMEDSPKHEADQNKLDEKKVNTAWFHFQKILEKTNLLRSDRE